MKAKQLTLTLAILCGTAALLPATAQASTAKEHALDYCKRNEATALDYDPNSDGHNKTDRWYGQDRNRFMDWRECVTTKTREFAVEKEPAKAEYQPTDKDRAYARQYCGRKYENKTDGRVWYGGAAEAEDPSRTVSNSNFFVSQESCIEAKTAESYYGATVIGDAPYQKQSNEDLARLYCTGEQAVRHGRKVTVYGVGVASYDSQEACISDQKAHLDRYSEYVAKVKAQGGIMQPYDAGVTVSAAAAADTGTESAHPDILKDKVNINQDECAIWLCLPAGFPQGCGSAHKAMLKRLKKGRSALPDFNSCAIGDAEQPEHGFASSEEFVIKVGDTYHPGYSCLKPFGKADNGDWIPGCTGVYKRITVTQHGKAIGQTHYELVRANRAWEGRAADGTGGAYQQ